MAKVFCRSQDRATMIRTAWPQSTERKAVTDQYCRIIVFNCPKCVAVCPFFACSVNEVLKHQQAPLNKQYTNTVSKRVDKPAADRFSAERDTDSKYRSPITNKTTVYPASAINASVIFSKKSVRRSSVIVPVPNEEEKSSKTRQKLLLLF